MLKIVQPTMLKLPLHCNSNLDQKNLFQTSYSQNQCHILMAAGRDIPVPVWRSQNSYSSGRSSRAAAYIARPNADARNWNPTSQPFFTLGWYLCYSIYIPWSDPHFTTSEIWPHLDILPSCGAQSLRSRRALENLLQPKPPWLGFIVVLIKDLGHDSAPNIVLLMIIGC